MSKEVLHCRPLPILSAYGIDYQYGIHATSDIVALSGRHMLMAPESTALSANPLITLTRRTPPIVQISGASLILSCINYILNEPGMYVTCVFNMDALHLTCYVVKEGLNPKLQTDIARVLA